MNYRTWHTSSLNFEAFAVETVVISNDCELSVSDILLLWFSQLDLPSSAEIVVSYVQLQNCVVFVFDLSLSASLIGYTARGPLALNKVWPYSSSAEITKFSHSWFKSDNNM